jgi:hypothetical protein
LRPIRSDSLDAGTIVIRLPTTTSTSRIVLVLAASFSVRPCVWLRYVTMKLTRTEPPIRKKSRDATSQT